MPLPHFEPPSLAISVSPQGTGGPGSNSGWALPPSRVLRWDLSAQCFPVPSSVLDTQHSASCPPLGGPMERPRLSPSSSSCETPQRCRRRSVGQTAVGPQLIPAKGEIQCHLLSMCFTIFLPQKEPTNYSSILERKNGHGAGKWRSWDLNAPRLGASPLDTAGPGLLAGRV